MIHTPSTSHFNPYSEHKFAGRQYLFCQTFSWLHWSIRFTHLIWQPQHNQWVVIKNYVMTVTTTAASIQCIFEFLRKNWTCKMSHPNFGETDAHQYMLQSTSTSVSCAQVHVCNDWHNYCSAESFQCVDWIQLWVLMNMILSRSVILVSEKPMPSTFCRAKHAHWVVLKYSVMTGTTTAVQSHFNARIELKFEFWWTWFCQRVSSLYQRSRCQVHSPKQNMLIELCSSTP